MKITDLGPLIFGGVTAFVGSAGLWFTGAKLRDERRKDQDAHDERMRSERDSASTVAAGYYKQLTDSLMTERKDREEAIRLLQTRVDDLSNMIDTLEDGLGRKDVQIAALTEQNKTLLDQHTHDTARIEQLSGELRNLKQIGLSAASNASRDSAG